MTLSNQLILDRINYYLENEGIRKERLAHRMGKSPSAFYAHLSGKHPKTTYQFAIELGTLLGLTPVFFIDQSFQYDPLKNNETDLEHSRVFSAGKLTDQGKEGLKQIGKLCDLVEIYK